MSRKCCQFQQHWFSCFIKIPFSNSALLEVESILCRNNEVIFYVKKVILFSENIEPVSLSLCMTPTSARIICTFFGEKVPKPRRTFLKHLCGYHFWENHCPVIHMFGTFVSLCLPRVLGWHCLETTTLSFSKYGKIRKSENGETNIGASLKNHINHREIVQTTRIVMVWRLSTMFIALYVTERPRWYCCIRRFLLWLPSKTVIWYLLFSTIKIIQ